MAFFRYQNIILFCYISLHFSVNKGHCHTDQPTTDCPSTMKKIEFPHSWASQICIIFFSLLIMPLQIEAFSRRRSQAEFQTKFRWFFYEWRSGRKGTSGANWDSRQRYFCHCVSNKTLFLIFGQVERFLGHPILGKRQNKRYSLRRHFYLHVCWRILSLSWCIEKKRN